MIEKYTFGEFVIDGKKYKSNVVLIGKDAKPGRYLTEHLLMIDDFIEIVESHPEIIVIGTGADGVVDVPDEIISFIESKKIKLIIEKTEEACAVYNSFLKKGKKIGAFLHNTC